MNIVKKVVSAVWPIIMRVLEKQVEKTETKFDDYALMAVNAAVLAWIESDDDDVKFE